MQGLSKDAIRRGYKKVLVYFPFHHCRHIGFCSGLRIGQRLWSLFLGRILGVVMVLLLALLLSLAGFSHTCVELRCLPSSEGMVTQAL